MANEKRIIPLQKRIIYAGALWQKTFVCDEVAEVRKFIETAPTVDAVEVVYCKDCKSHHWEQEPCHGKTVHICSKLKAEVTRDFYCAAGERRE